MFKYFEAGYNIVVSLKFACIQVHCSVGKRAMEKFFQLSCKSASIAYIQSTRSVCHWPEKFNCFPPPNLRMLLHFIGLVRCFAK